MPEILNIDSWLASQGPSMDPASMDGASMDVRSCGNIFNRLEDPVPNTGHRTRRRKHHHKKYMRLWKHRFDSPESFWDWLIFYLRRQLA